jgi:[protein-PII] uridylyltransferase
VARRLCLDHESRSLLIWLVDHHMSMSTVAQRRDIDDPQTIRDFREIVGSRERLDMLHLLTFVDGQAVGSTSWNEWRQTMLWQLYDLTAQALSTSGLDQINIETQRENLKKSVREDLPAEVSEEEIEAHFTHMPQRYWRRSDSTQVAWHLETAHEFFMRLLDEEIEATAPVIRWRHFPDRGYSEAVVCSWDRHGLFAKIAGSFAAARINILSADIFTRSDNLVLDIFQVCDLEHHAIRDGNRTNKVARLLSDSLTGRSEVQFSDQIREEYESMRRIPLQDKERFPTTIIFNNDDSAEYTILEVQTPDRLGLLYHILEVLAGCGIDVCLAKINTEKGAAMDVFYITDTQGTKIFDPERLQSIQQELKTTIDTLNQPYR